MKLVRVKLEKGFLFPSGAITESCV
jgi:hypothetical protein